MLKEAIPPEVSVIEELCETCAEPQLQFIQTILKQTTLVYTTLKQTNTILKQTTNSCLDCTETDNQLLFRPNWNRQMPLFQTTLKQLLFTPYRNSQTSQLAYTILKWTMLVSEMDKRFFLRPYWNTQFLFWPYWSRQSTLDKDMLKQNKRHTHTKKNPPLPNILEQAASTPQQQHADKKGKKTSNWLHSN